MAAKEAVLVTYVGEQGQRKIVDHARCGHPLGRLDFDAVAQLEEDEPNTTNQDDWYREKQTEAACGVLGHEPEQRRETEVRRPDKVGNQEIGQHAHTNNH